MKRMVKNGDLLDVESNGDLGVAGNTQVDGRLQVNSSIIANGEIRGGDISGTKFLLGTEEMPLVKANPAGDAAGTLEKIKIGDVAYKVGGGGSSDREITLVMPYDSSNASSNKKIYIDEETYNKINNKYYETIKIYYNDGNPVAVFHVVNLTDSERNMAAKVYVSVSDYDGFYKVDEWFGSNRFKYCFAKLLASSDSNGKFAYISGYSYLSSPDIIKSKFDALYKLADKPTQDGTYVLKATVSGGAVTYTWVAQ